MPVGGGNVEVMNTLQPGDVVKFDRGLYNHFALYVGERKVIHLDKVGLRRGVVKEDYFSDVAGESLAYKVDRDRRPKPVHEILEKARSMIGKKYYNVTSDNCEHFVNECRYGDHRSDQVRCVLTKVTQATCFTGLVFGGVNIIHRSIISRPKSVNEILDLTKSILGMIDYDLTFDNCEHFLNGCRYDDHRSDQVRRALMKMARTACVHGLFFGGVNLIPMFVLSR